MRAPDTPPTAAAASRPAASARDGPPPSPAAAGAVRVRPRRGRAVAPARRRSAPRAAASPAPPRSPGADTRRPLSAPGRANGRSPDRSSRRRASNAERRPPGASAISWLAWRSPHRSAWRATLPAVADRQRQVRSALPQRVAGFVGFGGRVRSESVSGLDRNQCPLCVGIRIPIVPRRRCLHRRRNLPLQDAKKCGRR